MFTLPPVALSIAGSDCSAGAGMQADLKTFQHFQVHGLTAVTCVVSETSKTVQAIHPIPAEIVSSQIDLLLASFSVSAIKTGMLYSAEIISAVAKSLKPHESLNLVIDPVMVASSGSSLLENAAISAYKNELFPLARVITPNIPEAEALLGKRIASPADMESAALELAVNYQTSILLKGGHLAGNQCIDILATDEGVECFSHPRIAVSESHGTGCTLSAALAAALAHGHSLARAVQIAKDYLATCLRDSYILSSPTRIPFQCLNQATVRSRDQVNAENGT